MCFYEEQQLRWKTTIYIAILTFINEMNPSHSAHMSSKARTVDIWRRQACLAYRSFSRRGQGLGTSGMIHAPVMPMAKFPLTLKSWEFHSEKDACSLKLLIMTPSIKNSALTRCRNCSYSEPSTWSIAERLNPLQAHKWAWAASEAHLSEPHLKAEYFQLAKSRYIWTLLMLFVYKTYTCVMKKPAFSFKPIFKRLAAKGDTDRAHWLPYYWL